MWCICLVLDPKLKIFDEYCEKGDSIMRVITLVLRFALVDFDIAYVRNWDIDLQEVWCYECGVCDP